MGRLENFHNLKNHPYLAKDFAKLSVAELAFCEKFIIDRDQKDDNAYAFDCNRLSIIIPIPGEFKKHASLIWGLLLQSITVKKQIRRE